MAISRICLCLLLCFVVKVLGELDCEELQVEDCAFAVSSSGARCVLEKYPTNDGEFIYLCQTSSIMAQKKGWIETEECLKSCGVERLSIGISTDGMASRSFATKLCSPACQNNCPNLVDLFTKLAAEEGVYLPHVCSFLHPSFRRLVSESMVLSRNTRAMLQQLGASDPAPAQAPSPSS